MDITKGVKAIVTVYENRIATPDMLEHLKKRIKTHLKRYYGILNVDPHLKVKVGANRYVKSIEVEIMGEPLIDAALPEIMRILEQGGRTLNTYPVPSKTGNQIRTYSPTTKGKERGVNSVKAGFVGYGIGRSNLFQSDSDIRSRAKKTWTNRLRKMIGMKSVERAKEARMMQERKKNVDKWLSPMSGVLAGIQTMKEFETEQEQKKQKWWK